MAGQEAVPGSRSTAAWASDAAGTCTPALPEGWQGRRPRSAREPVWLGCLVADTSAQSCPTPVTPWTVAQQAPLSIGLSRQEYWSRLLFPSPGDLPEPGIKPGSPALQADSLPTEVSAKPKSSVLCVNLKLHLRAGNRDLGNNSFSERGVHFSLWAVQGRSADLPRHLNLCLLPCHPS